MSILSSTPAVSSFGRVIAPMPARGADKVRLDLVDRHTIEYQARVNRAQVLGEMIGGGIARLWGHVRMALRRRAAIAELNALDDRMLADIGLSRGLIHAAVDSAAGFGPDLLAGPGAVRPFDDNAYKHAA
jgi:uncharacterized protein YjiS (DUF1127 family)